MFEVSKSVARHKLLRNAAMVAFVVPTALLAGCASEPPPPPPQPVVYQPPPPAPAPPPARVIGERD